MGERRLDSAKMESDKHECWGTPAEGPRDHVDTGGSLLGVAGKWCACGWSVVPLDRDEEMLPIRGMYGTLDADLDVQRTIKRAELTLFFVSSGNLSVQLWSLSTTKESLMVSGEEMRRTPTCAS